MLQVQIRTRVLGIRADEPQLPNVIINILEEQITVGELITRTVEEQVRDLLLTRRLDAMQAQQALDRHYLVNPEVKQQAAQGRVKMPTRIPTAQPRIDLAAEMRKALQAFQAGTYLVIVDGRQCEQEDECLQLHANSKIMFLRLTPLVGG
jgi:hypothetical protein